MDAVLSLSRSHGKSKTELMREFNINWNTLAAIMHNLTNLGLIASEERMGQGNQTVVYILTSKGYDAARRIDSLSDILPLPLRSRRPLN